MKVLVSRPSLTLFGLLAGLLAATPALADYPPGSVEYFNSHGLELLNAHKNAEAEVLFKQGLALCEASKANDPPCAAINENMGDVARAAKRLPEAEHAYNEALRIRTALSDADRVSMIQLKLGRMYADNRRDAEGEKYLLRVIDGSANPGGGPIYMTVALRELAKVYDREQRYDDMRAPLDKALSICPTLQRQPNDCEGESELLYAGMLAATGKLDEAEKHLAAAHAAFDPKTLAGPRASTLMLAGLFYFRDGRFADAETIDRQALTEALANEALLTDDDMYHANAYLAGALNAQGKNAEAEPFYQKAVEYRARRKATDPKGYADALYGLANVHARLHKADAEAAELREYSEVTKQSLSETYEVLGDLLKNGGHNAEAVVAAREAVRLADTDRQKAAALRSLGLTLFYVGETSEADQTLQQALAIKQADDRTVADASMVLGQLRITASANPETEALLHRAIDLYAKRDGAKSDAFVDANRRLGDYYAAQGRFAEAEPLMKAAVDWYDTHHGGRYPQTGMEALHLGELYVTLKRYKEAEPLFQHALDVYQKSAGPDHPLTARSWSDLGDLYGHEGRFSDALAAFDKSIAIYTSHEGFNSVSAALVMTSQGSLNVARGDFDDAEPELSQAIKIFEDAGVNGQSHVLGAEDALAFAYSHHGQYDEAEAAYLDSLHRREAAYGKDSPNLVVTLSALGQVELPRGRFADSEADLKRALDIARTAYGEHSGITAATMATLAQSYIVQHKLNDAEPLIAGAVTSAAADPKMPPSGNAVLLWQAAQFYMIKNDLPKAEDYAKRDVEIAHLSGDESSDVQHAAQMLGEIYFMEKRLPDAEPNILKSLSLAEKLWGPGNVATFPALMDAAHLRFQQQKLDDADALLARALDVANKAYHPDSPYAANVLNDRSDIRVAQKRLPEAEADLKQALDIFRAHIKGDSPIIAYVELSLANVERQQGKASDADALTAQAKKVLGDLPANVAGAQIWM